MSFGRNGNGHVSESPATKKFSAASRFNFKLADGPGELAWLPVSDLQIDPRYQRGRNNRKVIRIAKAWSWLACGVILVARRPDGRLLVYDGGSRTEAARFRGDIERLPCFVFDVQGVEQEAQAFLCSNKDRNPVSAMEQFDAKLITKDKNALLVAQMVDVYGYTLTRNSNKDSRKTISCVARLEKLAARSPQLFELVFGLAVECSRGAHIHENVFVAIFYAQLPFWQHDDKTSLFEKPWRERIIRLGHAGILDAVQKARIYKGQWTVVICGNALIDAINKGVRNKLPLLPVYA